jgi:DNA-binding transcriptional ArsR family regulator
MGLCAILLVMRPPAKPQSALTNPLNTILGREANVRILRALALESVPIGRTDLAQLVQLQPRGMKKLLEALEDAGVVETVGRGRRQSYRLRASDRLPLVNAIRELFKQEKHRADAILSSIAQGINNHGSAIRAAWIEGSVAEQSDRVGDSIEVVALAAQPDDTHTPLSVRAAMNQVQAEFDVAIELRIVHQADLDSLSAEQRTELDHVRPVSGPPPRHFIEPLLGRRQQSVHRGHAGQDAVLLDRARLVAETIRRDPSVIARAKDWIDERLTVVSPGEYLELSEWRDILTSLSPARVRRLLTHHGERATRLRQSMPFLDEAK